MAVTPDTTIRLLKVPIEIDNMNQLTFTNLTAQYNYFHNLPNYIEEEDLYYQRKDNYIMFPAHIDSILQYNYCMYQNSNYSNKWFYAFITNMEYENDGTTRIYIETDCFQTWQFDIIYKASFIEREHVNDDTIGLHTIPENLDVGDTIQLGEAIEDQIYSNSLGYYVAIMGNYVIKDNSTGTEVLDSDKGIQFDGISVIDNVIFGNTLFLFPITSAYPDFTSIYEFLIRTNNDGHINDISSMFVLPNAAISVSQLIPHSAKLTLNNTEYTFTWYTLPVGTTPETFNTTIEKPISFTDITLKNNKSLIYPYNYLFVTNNNGTNNIFKYEDFSGTSCVFENQLVATIGCSGRLVPRNYKGMSYNDDEAIALGKYPTCSWSGDAYTNWMTQNSVNIVANTLISAASTAVSLGALGAKSGAAVKSASKAEKARAVAEGGLGLIGTIASTIGEMRAASLMPNIEGGQATGDVLWACDRNTFTFRRMRAKKEYLQVIDDFFSAYGYKVNATKLPNITGRTNWNYVKTINANIEGDIPQEDLQKIKDILNNGVTFWHNPLTFLDYSQSNTII